MSGVRVPLCPPYNLGYRCQQWRASSVSAHHITSLRMSAVTRLQRLCPPFHRSPHSMPPRLIINADDFGLTLGINRAIIELHRAGVLTSATLMAAGPAFDDAAALAHSNPSLGVGCHIVLTDGTPASPPETIPTLLGPDSKTFRPSLIDFLQALLRGRIREDDIEREAFAQIHKLQQAGIPITHVDTHKHTHLFPAVARPLLRVLERTSVSAIRNPFEPAFTQRLAHANLK